MVSKLEQQVRDMDDVAVLISCVAKRASANLSVSESTAYSYLAAKRHGHLSFYAYQEALAMARDFDSLMDYQNYAKLKRKGVVSSEEEYFEIRNYSGNHIEFRNMDKLASEEEPDISPAELAHELMQCLSDRETEVIFRRFFLGEIAKKCAKEVGRLRNKESGNLTRTRIDQIQHGALRKMRMYFNRKFWKVKIG